MSGDYPFPSKIVSPAKCNEKPWDLWIGEIGRLSPRADDQPSGAGGAARRASGKRRYRRAGLHRLRHDTMSLHGLFPQMDTLDAAVCHLCGVVVKCSAAYRHLSEAHADSEALLPPPPPAPSLRTRARHRKEQHPPSPADLPPLKIEAPPAAAATAPASRLVLPPPELYLEESSAAPEVQVCVESGELPVVSIQDPEELPLGENLTDDIFAIMNSEGIQSADDIANSADWKNIIRDIGNLQDITFSQGAEAGSASELYAAAPLAPYGLTDAELAGLQLPPEPAPAPPPPPAKPPTPTTPTARSQARAKPTKTKFNLREYDPNKHCGVVIAETGKPCTRSLTCKAHALSLRRTVEGRAKPFDTLLAEHRAARDAPPAPPPAAPLLDLGAFNGLTAEQHVDDIYATLLSVESSAGMLADPGALSSLLGRPPPGEAFAPPAEAERAPAAAGPAPPAASAARAGRREGGEEVLPTDVCWYASCPRPLALCTFNARHAGGAVALGKRYATVRSNLKSSLSRQKGAGGGLYCAPAPAKPKGRPEVRRLVARGAARCDLSPALNGHAAARPKAPLELAFALDPLLADEKC